MPNSAAAPSSPPSSPAQSTSTLVGNGTSVAEGLKGLFCGVLFGITSPLVGHPFDSLKTKMQAQTTYAYTKDSTITILKNIVKKEGFLSLYKGLTPPLIGSSIFRAIQFASYGTMYAALKDTPEFTRPIPELGDMQLRVFIAAIFSTTCRTIIETPLEMLKVRRQTQQSWLPTIQGGVTRSSTPANASSSPSSSSTAVSSSTSSSSSLLRQPRLWLPIVRSLYTGFGITWIRTLFALGGFFVIIDHVDRHHHTWINIPYVGPFVKGSLCTTLAWILSWPFEVLKNQTQANTPLNSSVASDSTSVYLNARTRLRYILRTIHQQRTFTERLRATQPFFRGIGPGTLRSILANGAALSVYTMCQKSM